MSAGRPLVRAGGEHSRVTELELFFDLVFVFAFTQVTQLMADDPSWRGAVRGLVLMALLWWAWSAYAWLGNQARADEGVVRLAVVGAMAAMFVVALAIPESFADLPGGLVAPFVLAACYAAVRLLHLGTYLVAARGDPALRRTLLRAAVPVVAAAGLLVAGGAAGPPVQTVLWAAALVVDYSGIYLSGPEGWQLRGAAHFAERHGLIVIVAIGESLVAIGVGVARYPVSVPVVGGAVCGVVLAACLWWLYFDVVARVVERRMAALRGAERTRLARDSYTYLHFPLVASVLFIALGLKKVMQYVADGDPATAALSGVPLLALYGGLAVHLLAHVAFRRRGTGTWNPHRTLAAVLLLALVPVADRLPALGALALATAVLVGLVGYEVARFADARARVRGGGDAG